MERHAAGARTKASELKAVQRGRRNAGEREDMQHLRRKERWLGEKKRAAQAMAAEARDKRTRKLPTWLVANHDSLNAIASEVRSYAVRGVAKIAVGVEGRDHDGPSEGCFVVSVSHEVASSATGSSRIPQWAAVPTLERLLHSMFELTDPLAHGVRVAKVAPAMKLVMGVDL